MATITTTVTTIILLLTLFTTTTTTNSATIYTNSITPNFTTSHFLLIDNSGDFLRSLNHTYTAAILNPPSSPSLFYLLIYHTSSHTVTWSANPHHPIPISGQLHLTPSSLSLLDQSGQPIWSTPKLNSTITSLQLLDTGNLILLDQSNGTIWQAFDYPTDTIVSSQRLHVGTTLKSTNSIYSIGDYTFTVTSRDGILQWQNLTYYSLLTDSKSVINSNVNVHVTHLMVNGSGLYLFGDSEQHVVVIRVMISELGSGYRILKVTNDGFLVVMRYMDNDWVTDFSSPVDSCRPLFRCGKLGLCSTGSCSCPPGFRHDPVAKLGCSVSDDSVSLPESCNNNNSNSNSSSSINNNNNTSTSTSISISTRNSNSNSNSNLSENYMYMPLGSSMKYIPVEFMEPVRTGVSLLTCKDLCSASCTCLGLFHGEETGSCYLIENYLGSIVLSSNHKSDDKLGFIKAVVELSSTRNDGGDSGSDFPVIGLVLLPATGVLVMAVFAVWMRIRRKRKRMKENSKKSSENSDDLEMFSIAGLPVRFGYEELVEATVNFGTPIGSGGFGTVYKGVLRDKTVVAVKKITALGAQGKKEFGTEIAIIGNIHHVNLVKLRGFCAHGRERFLVYEYMNRGSLDRTLFCPGPPMEWQERFEIALGTARGLAYLHSECEHKIIHCDVKPENILLNDNMQVKISDFGLSKLLSPEQSGLFTTMRGTRGYLAPEWLTNAAISDKTDVYSYGMVILELIQGRKNCVRAPSHGSGNPSTSTDGQSSISSGSQNRPRARAFYFPLQALEMHEEGRYLELVEPRLAGRVTNDEAAKLVKVALCCLHEDPSLRPTMANVVAMLEGTLPVGEPRLESLNFLRFYGRRFTEPSTVVTGAEIELPSGLMVSTVDSSSPSASPNSYSYMSSQQVSGPR